MAFCKALTLKTDEEINYMRTYYIRSSLKINITYTFLTKGGFFVVQIIMDLYSPNVLLMLVHSDLHRSRKSKLSASKPVENKEVLKCRLLVEGNYSVGNHERSPTCTFYRATRCGIWHIIPLL